MDIRRYKRRYWAVYSPTGELITVCVYKKGAKNVVRLLEEKPLPGSGPRRFRLGQRAGCLPQCKETLRSRTLRHVPPLYKRTSQAAKPGKDTLL